MILETGKFYHLYNRSNNGETVFKEERNYRFFLEKYKRLVSSSVETVAYCLMPTHFHFCIKVTTTETDRLKHNIGILLSSYTKAINKQSLRHGSLFQQHSKTIEVDQLSYLITLCHYIHQNPLRAGIVFRLRDWPHSSYPDYAGGGTSIPLNSEYLLTAFGDRISFIRESNELIDRKSVPYRMRGRYDR